jgi:pimeloyl-ACP methyl ester carboxylesterase
MRGHGLSERFRPDEPFDMVADLAAILKYLGIKSPVVAGHSMGGELTLGVLGASLFGLSRTGGGGKLY